MSDHTNTLPLSRRAFIAGVLMLPFLAVTPDQVGGRIEMNCGLGDDALVVLYVGGASVLFVDFHYYDTVDGTAKIKRGTFTTPRPQFVSAWFLNDGTSILFYVVWGSIAPAVVDFASCI